MGDNLAGLAICSSTANVRVGAARPPMREEEQSAPVQTCRESGAYVRSGLMAHHKRKRPKHRRSGCLLCKPQKLPAAVKAERAKADRSWRTLERAAW